MIWWALAACTPEPAPPGTVEVSQLAIQLVTPAEIDPMAGADALVVEVFDTHGALLAEASGGIDEGLTLGELDDFGVVDVRVSARAGDAVISGGRTGPIVISADEQRSVEILFLPVNEAVQATWVPVADRVEHLTVALPDGRVMLLGGRRPSSSIVMPSTEWWSPFGGFGTEGPELPGPLYRAVTTPFDGRDVLVAGGRYGQSEDARSADVFTIDPDGGYEALPPMEAARDGHCLGAFQERSVVAIGGRGLTDDRTIEVLRPGGGGGFAWNTMLMDELVTSDVTGCVGTSAGFVVTTGATDEAWGVFDLRTASNDQIPSSFDPIAGAPGPLEGAMLIPLADEAVLALGGFASGPRAEGWTVYAPQASAEAAPDLASARAWAQWRWYEEGETLVVAGGYEDRARSRPITSAELYDLDDGSVLEIELPLKEPRVDVVPGGALLFTGGITTSGDPAGAWVVVPWDLPG